jgi:hypothetical protein
MKPTYEDLQAEVWDLRCRLERAERGDQSRDVVSAQAFQALQRRTCDECGEPVAAWSGWQRVVHATCSSSPDDPGP